MGIRIDEMGHAGRLRCGDDCLAVRTDAHALRLDTDGDLGDRGLGAKIDYRDQIVVLVCDVESLAVGARTQIRIRAYQPTTL